MDHALSPRPLFIPPKIRTDAIRFALDRSTPEGCEPLVSTVVEQTRVVLQDGGKGRDDYSVLVSTRATSCAFFPFGICSAWILHRIFRVKSPTFNGSQPKALLRVPWERLGENC